MGTAGTVTIDVDVATAKLEAGIARGASQFASAVQGMQTKAIAVGATIGSVLGAGITEAVRSLSEFVEKGVETTAQIAEMSQQVGVSTETLSALRREAGLTGTDFETLRTGIIHMSTAASEGSTVFAKMGINVKDGNGNLKSTQDILTAVAAKLDSYSDSSAKTALAQKVFGKAGADLIPMLNQLGSQGLQSVIDQTKAAGVLMDGDAAEAAEQFKNNLNALHTASDDFGISLSKELTPALNEAVKLFQDPEFQDALHGIAQAIGDIATAAVKAAGGLAELLNQGHSILGWAETGAVSDSRSMGLSQSQLSADRQELAMRQDPANNGMFGRMGGSKGSVTNSFYSQDSIAALTMSDEELQAQIKRDQQAQYDYNAKLWNNGASTIAPAEPVDTKPKTQAPLIGNPGDAAAARKALDASQNLQKLTNSLTGKAGTPDDQAWADFSNTLNQINEDAKEMIAGGMKQNDVLVQQAAATDAATAVWKKYQKQQQEQIQDYTDALKQQTDARQTDIDFQVKAVSEGDKELAQEKALFDIRNQAAQQQLALDKQRDRNEISPDTYAQKTAELKAQTDQQVADQVNGLKRIDAAQADWSTGATKAMKDYADQSANVAAQTQTMFTNAFGSMTDALVGFVTTGKLNFTSLATSILTDLARMELRIVESKILQAILGPTITDGSNAFAGGGENFSQDTGGLGAYNVLAHAKGGVYQSPSLSAYSGNVYSTPHLFAFAKGAGVFGEAGPEAIMPLTTGSDGKLGVRAQISSAGSGTVNNFNFYNSTSVDNSGSKSQATSDNSNALGSAVNDMMKKAANDAIVRALLPGGAIWNVQQRRA